MCAIVVTRTQHTHNIPQRDVSNCAPRSAVLHQTTTQPNPFGVPLTHTHTHTIGYEYYDGHHSSLGRVLNKITLYFFYSSCAVLWRVNKRARTPHILEFLRIDEEKKRKKNV